MTQRLANPASSAVLPISANLGPIQPSPSGQLKLGICSPMRMCPSPLAAHADEDVLAGEAGGEVFGGSGAELEPDHVPRPHLPRDRPDAVFSRSFLDKIRQLSGGLRDV